MTSENPIGSKEELRARCRRYLETLGDDRYERLSSAVVRRALDSGAFDDAEVVHIYWPMTTRHEIDTRPLIKRLQKSGKRIVIPCFDEASDPSAGNMLYRVFAGVEKMQKNRWGTYEPIAAEAVPPARVDLVVAPALGADRLGYRLGHGGGFYDRFLKDADCPALSLVYSECLFDIVPHDRHDVKVGLIVTEDELVRPTGPATWQAPDRN